MLGFGPISFGPISSLSSIIQAGVPPLGTNTLWCGDEAAKLYVQSGQFTSTIKTSEDISGIDEGPQGISWDEINTLWCGATDDKLYLQSGQFTSTLKTSISVTDQSSSPEEISTDNIDTIWISSNDDILFVTSGQFTSTIKTSLNVNLIDTAAVGITWDGINTPWCGIAEDKLYLTSGRFTSTIKTSEDVGGIDDTPLGISWDGVDTSWCGNEANKLYLTSGQFTSTIKTSEAVGGIDTAPSGIEHGDLNARLGLTPVLGNDILFAVTATADREVLGIASNNIAFTNVATQSFKIGIISNDISFTNDVENNFVFDSAFNNIAFAVIAVSNIKIGIASNDIAFDNVSAGQIPRQAVASNDITLTPVGSGARAKLGIATNNILFGAAVRTNILIFSLFNNVSFTSIISPAGSEYNRLLSNDIGFTHLAQTTIEASVSNDIAFTSQANRSGLGTNSISFTNTATAVITKKATNSVAFTVNVVANGNFTKVVSNTISFTTGAVGSVITDCGKFEYTPAGGALPSLTLGIRSDITLDCSGSPQLVLRNPNFGDSQLLEPTRARNTSRGGTHSVFRDSQWPKDSLLEFTISLMKVAKRDEVETFLASCIGKLITLTDQEDNQWIGIITNPDADILEIADNSYEVTLQLSATRV